MDRRGRPKKAKAGAKRPLASKSPKDPVGTIRALEKRLTESLKRERSTVEILREKNRALTEALEQQTATAEILRVISRSPSNLPPVLDTVVAAAARFCGAPNVVMTRLEGGMLRAVAAAGPFADDVARHGQGLA